MKVLVSTDSSCLVNQNVFDKCEINVFPLNVIIDGEEFLDGVTINQAQLAEAMRAKKDIKTSTPPLGEVIEYFEKLFERGYDHIIHFTISSKLSSMNDLFKNVAEQNFNGKVTVIDSRSVSAHMLCQVFMAYDEVNKGTPVEEIVKKCEEMRAQTPLLVIPENLNALKNGGRISPTVALIGNSIGIKPLIAMIDGALEKQGMVRNVKRTIVDAINDSINKYSLNEYDYTLIVFDPDERTVSYIYESVADKIPADKLIKGVLPVNVCAHVGPGAIGLVVSPRINGKSINDFM